MARVVFERVGKSFPDGPGRNRTAVREFSLAIEDRELLVLVGPSGSGKTTTLRLLAGLEEPNEGVISLDGRSLRGVDPVERDLALVFQHGALFPHLTARQNIALGLHLRGLSRQEAEQRVRETAALAGLTDQLERMPSTLSGGERQRVALARALARRPKVLLLDEPLASLDGPLREQTRRDIARWHQEMGTTTIYITHDQREALALGHRVAVLHEGVLQQVAAPRTLYQEPANLFVAGFIGSPRMNLVPGHLRLEGEQWLWVPAGPANLKQECWPLPAKIMADFGLATWKDRDLVLGLRPEHVLADQGSRSHGLYHTSGRIERAEPLGAATNLFVLVAGHLLNTSTTLTEPASAGQQVSLGLDLSQARFFDPAQGIAIV